MPDKSKIRDLTLSDVMNERFSRYSKAIIQERALPDVRDGLKPVQRRILYAMNLDGNTSNKGFRKSAKTVGNVMGNFHPHGDSSIYEAMIRMSQDWKLRVPLVETHGNNGSMDGDPPAAMRYTEARLSKISDEMLRDIDKDTVDWVPNFDDTEKEPTVLPARFPNLLVNGANGISAGYATEIPPHNLSETIDALIYLLGHPEATLDDLMRFIKGPDFPTGGIIQGIEGIKQAYQTGRGKIIIRSKTAIEKLRGNKQVIKITEIPFEVNKAQLVKQMDEIRLNKKIDGIAEVRDETDRSGLQIAVELRGNADAQGILNYLFKNTDLQISYHFNVVAISDMTPKLLPLKEILSTYLNYQREIITKRTRYTLKKAKERQHIVEGLIKALSILDSVIKTIRGSKNRKDAQSNLVSEYDFSNAQAEAIVALQLYRLTNTDVTQLKEENAELAAKIAEYENILKNKLELDSVLKAELTEIAKKYKTKRLTRIEDHIQTLKVSQEVVVPDEDVMVMVSKDGYLKRSSLRSYKASDLTDNGLKEEDYPVFFDKLSTRDSLFMFTNRGHVIYRPVHEIEDSKWKDAGEHISQIKGVETGESIIAAFPFPDLKQDGEFVVATSAGHIKRVAFEQLKPGRTYKNRASVFAKMKNEADQVVNVSYRLKEDPENVMLMTENGFGLRYDLEEVPVNGAKTVGVKSMALAGGDRVIDCQLVNEQSQLAVIFQDGNFKKMKTSEVPKTSRARKGVRVLKPLKTKPNLLGDFQRIDGNDDILKVYTDHKNAHDLILNEFGLSGRTSNGSSVVNPKQIGIPNDIEPNLLNTSNAESIDLL